jgi:hypothetical protein
VDRITALLKFQWRAYWRRFHRGGNLGARNVGLLVLIGGIAVIRYLQQLPLTATQLAKGETARYEVLLIAFFVVWLVPVMGESKRPILSHNLLHLPLTTNELFLIRLGSVFCSPVTWIIVAASMVLGYPLAFAPHPVIGIAALLTFLLSALFTSLVLTHLLQSAFVRKLLLGALLAASVAGALLWLQRRTDIAALLKSILPNRLAAAAAVSSPPLRSIAVLAGLAALSAVLARWSFILTLQPRETRRSQRSALLGALQFPGKLGGLIKKDLRYSSRLLDLYLALPLVILFNVYLASNPAPSAIVFVIVVALLFFPSIAIAFNSFGLDSSPGLDRYALLPLSDKEKLFSKNLSFAAVMLVLFLTILPLTVWKLGVRVGLLGLIELFAVGLAYLSIGNWMSVRQPYKMQFYRFASGGSPVDALMGMLFGSIPAAVTVYLLARGDRGVFWKITVITIVYLAICFYSLSRSAHVLQNQREEIRRAVF